MHGQYVRTHTCECVNGVDVNDYKNVCKSENNIRLLVLTVQI